MRTDATESDSGIEARYANFFKVGQNSTEFLLQFAQFHPGADLVWITRIVIAPSFMKELLRMVAESVDAHEAKYGAIAPPTSDEDSQ